MAVRRRTLSELAWSVLTYAILAVLLFYVLFPFLWVLSTSLKPESQILTARPVLVPTTVTLQHYQLVLSRTLFVTYFRNSLLVATATAVSALVVGSLAAYAFSRMHNSPGIKPIALAMFLAPMIPGVLIILPLYLFMYRVGLLDTYWSMIIAYTTFAIPFSTWMLKGYFDSLPIELEDAARVDGADRLRVITRIVLPIALPGVVATGLYAFVLAWNEFLFGYTFVSSDSTRTLTPGIALFIGLWTVQWGSLTAAATLGVVPVAIAFAYLQKYLVAGLTSGSVKG